MGPGDDAVVADGGENAVGGEFDGDGGDAEGVVGFAVAGDEAGVGWFIWLAIGQRIGWGLRPGRGLRHLVG